MGNRVPVKFNICPDPGANCAVNGVDTAAYPSKDVETPSDGIAILFHAVNGVAICPSGKIG